MLEVSSYYVEGFIHISFIHINMEVNFGPYVTTEDTLNCDTADSPGCILRYALIDRTTRLCLSTNARYTPTKNMPVIIKAGPI